MTSEEFYEYMRNEFKKLKKELCPGVLLAEEREREEKAKEKQTETKSKKEE